MLQQISSNKKIYACPHVGHRPHMPKSASEHVFFHVFAQTTHVVAAPHGFACVVIPAARFVCARVYESDRALCCGV